METISGTVLEAGIAAVTPDDLWLGEGQLNSAGWIPFRPVTSYVLSADLGKMHDHTCLTLLRRQRLPIPPEEEGWIGGDLKQRGGPDIYSVLAMDRLNIGIDYGPQMDILKARLAQAQRRAGRIPVLCAIDHSGVGLGVAEMASERGIDWIGVSITGGTADSDRKGTQWHVSKSALCSRLQGVFHATNLCILNSILDASVLITELQNFTAKISDEGTATYSGSGRGGGKFGDCVLSLAIGLLVLGDAAKVGGNAWSVTQGWM